MSPFFQSVESMRRTDLEIRRRKAIQVEQTFCDKCTQLSMSFGVPQFLGSFVLCGPVDKWRRQVSCDLESYAKVDGSRTMICTFNYMVL